MAGLKTVQQIAQEQERLKNQQADNRFRLGLQDMENQASRPMGAVEGLGGLMLKGLNKINNFGNSINAGGKGLVNLAYTNDPSGNALGSPFPNAPIPQLQPQPQQPTQAAMPKLGVARPAESALAPIGQTNAKQAPVSTAPVLSAVKQSPLENLQNSLIAKQQQLVNPVDNGVIMNANTPGSMNNQMDNYKIARMASIGGDDSYSDEVKQAMIAGLMGNNGLQQIQSLPELAATSAAMMPRSAAAKPQDKWEKLAMEDESGKKEFLVNPQTQVVIDAQQLQENQPKTARQRQKDLSDMLEKLSIMQGTPQYNDALQYYRNAIKDHQNLLAAGR